MRQGTISHECHKRDSKTKAAFALEELKGKAVAHPCREHQHSQAQHYQWREPLLAHAGKAFDTEHQSQREAQCCSRRTSD